MHLKPKGNFGCWWPCDRWPWASYGTWGWQCQNIWWSQHFKTLLSSWKSCHGNDSWFHEKLLISWVSETIAWLGRDSRLDAVLRAAWSNTSHSFWGGDIARNWFPSKPWKVPWVRSCPSMSRSLFDCYLQSPQNHFPPNLHDGWRK